MSSKEDSSYTCTLGPETLKKAMSELHEDPSTRLIEVKTLRTRLEKVPGLVARTDTPFLLRFLRARKFDQERTFQLVLNHYQTRAKRPDIFADLKPSRIKPLLDDGIFDTLENRTENGCKVVIFRFVQWDPEKSSISSLLRAIYLTLYRATEDEETQVHGVHLIVILRDLSWRQACHATPSASKLAFAMLQDVIPLRLTRLESVYEPAWWDTIYAIFKPFIKEKLRNRIAMHGEKVENLYKDIKTDHLPTDLGGKIPLNDMFHKTWKETFLASDSQYEEDNKFGFVNMELSSDNTVSKSGDAGMAGLGGTFKKLDI